MDSLQNENPPPVKHSLFRRFMARVAAATPEILEKCPETDWDSIVSLGYVFIGTAAYMALIFWLVAQEVIANDGKFHPGLVAGAIFIAALIYGMDALIFVRAAHYAAGIDELRRGGLSLPGGTGVKIKAALFLLVRLFLSLDVAQLTAIGLGLVIFHDDVLGELNHRLQTENPQLIASATQHVDGVIARETDDLTSASNQLAQIQQQYDAARSGIVDPTDADSSVQAEQAEINELLVAKATRDSELSDAESWASDELAGKSGSGHSGVEGDGPVRRAAEERVQLATTNDEAAERALDDARTRLDNLRTQLATGAGDRAKQDRAALPDLQRDVQNQTADVAALRARVSSITEGRDEAIRNEIENSPDCKDCKQGMIAQLQALHVVAHEGWIKAIILFISIGSFSLEAAIIISTVTSLVPSTYSALLARDSYLRTIEIVDEMDAALRRQRPEENRDDALQPDPLPPIAPAGRGGEATAPSDAPAPDIFPLGSVNFNGAGAMGGTARRPRGRPRKDALNGGSPVPTGNYGNGHDQAEQGE